MPPCENEIRSVLLLISLPAFRKFDHGKNEVAVFALPFLNPGARRNKQPQRDELFPHQLSP